MNRQILGCKWFDFRVHALAQLATLSLGPLTLTWPCRKVYLSLGLNRIYRIPDPRIYRIYRIPDLSLFTVCTNPTLKRTVLSKTSEGYLKVIDRLNESINKSMKQKTINQYSNFFEKTIEVEKSLRLIGLARRG